MMVFALKLGRHSLEWHRLSEAERTYPRWARLLIVLSPTYWVNLSKPKWTFGLGVEIRRES